MERELFLELGGEDMVGGEKVGLSMPQPRTLTLATTTLSSHERGNQGSVPAREMSRLECDLKLPVTMKKRICN